MSLNPLHLLQIRDKVEYDWRHEASVSFMTVNYTVQKPWPPSPGKVNALKRAVARTIRSYDGSSHQTSAGLESGIITCVNERLQRKIVLSVTYGSKSKKSKS